MKGLITLAFFSLILSPYSFAKEPVIDRGTAAADEKYVDEIKTREAAIERKVETETTNSGQLYDQEDRQDRGYQKSSGGKEKEKTP